MEQPTSRRKKSASFKEPIDDFVEETEQVVSESKPLLKNSSTKSTRRKKQDKTEELSENTEEITGSAPARKKREPKTPKEPKQPNELKEPAEPIGNKFVCMIRLMDGTKSDESIYKIGYTNNVRDYRTGLEAAMPNNLKTEKVIECENGDADVICANFCKSLSSKEVKRGWFKVKKSELEIFVNDTTARPGYVSVPESKAKVAKLKRKKTE